MTENYEFIHSLNTKVQLEEMGSGWKWHCHLHLKWQSDNFVWDKAPIPSRAVAKEISTWVWWQGKKPPPPPVIDRPCWHNRAACSLSPDTSLWLWGTKEGSRTSQFRKTSPFVPSLSHIQPPHPEQCNSRLRLLLLPTACSCCDSSKSWQRWQSCHASLFLWWLQGQAGLTKQLKAKVSSKSAPAC